MVDRCHGDGVAAVGVAVVVRIITGPKSVAGGPSEKVAQAIAPMVGIELKGCERQWSGTQESLTVVGRPPGVGVDIYLVAFVAKRLRLDRVASPTSDESRACNGGFVSDAGDVERIVANRSGDTGDSGSVTVPTGGTRIVVVITPIV